MSLNNVDSSSGELIATGNDGNAVSTAIVQDVVDGNFSSVKNIQSKEEYANISEATVADTLVTSSPIANGDNLVIVKDDDSIHEVVASGVTGVGPYSMDTTAITAGEIPSKVFTVDSKISFDDGTGFIYPSELGNNYLFVNNAAPVPDLTPGLVAHYLLNNNADDSHGNYDGVDYKPFTPPIYNGDSVSILGTNGAVIITELGNSYNQASTATFSIWVRMDNLNNQSIIGRWGPTVANTSFALAYSNVVGFLFQVRDADGTTYAYSASREVANIGQLYHVVGSINNGVVNIYVDGVLKETSYSAGLNINTSSYNTYFGLYHDGTGDFAGKMSNARCYADAKDQTFIDELFAEGYYPKPLTKPTTVGLVAHYPLTGTAEDSTGTYDGTEVGTLTYLDSDEFGSVASFNGTDSYIENTAISVIANTTGFTISMWAYYNASDDSNVFFGDTASNSYYMYCGVSGVGARFVYTNNGVTELAYTVALPSTGWYHIVGIFANGSSKLYVNDVLEIDDTGVLNNMVVLDTMTLGALKRLAVIPYNGDMRDVRIYNAILTPQKITDIYNYEKNFRAIDIDDGLIAYYPLAKNSLDNYYNEFDGTDSTGVTYDGSEATLPIGDNITFPTATGFVEAYYVEDGVFKTTTTESVLNDLTDCTLSEVRKYNKSLTAEQIAIIKEEVSAVLFLTNTRQYNDIIANGRTIETKVELKSIGDKCTEVSADIWKTL